MKFQKGHPKHGGRKSGAHNKITRDVEGLLNKLGCNPLEGLATIASDERIPPSVRAHCYGRLAKFVHPELQSVQISGNDGGPIKVALETIDRLTRDGSDSE